MLTRIIGLCGRRYQGKTFLAKKFLDAAPRAITYEWKREEKFAGYTQVNSYDPLKAIMAQPTWKIAYHPKSTDGDLPWFCDMLRWTGNCIVLFDECQEYMNSAYAPDSIRSLIGISRHLGLHLVFATQRPINLNANMLSQATDLYCFQLQHYLDIERIEREDPLGRTWAEKLRSLNQGEYVHIEL